MCDNNEVVNRNLQIMKLRNYQEHIEQETYAAWQAGHQNVMAALATGGGKTPIIGKIADSVDGVGLAFAHRNELVPVMAFITIC
jgi:superfamily II DNA or RNA helicase